MRIAPSRRVAAAGVLAVVAGLQLGFASAAAAAGKTHTVVIEAMAFVPASVNARAGDTIVWQNRDLFPHTATADDHSFDSGEIPAGKSWKRVVTKRGKTPYLCTFHPLMKGSLVVD